MNGIDDVLQASSILFQTSAGNDSSYTYQVLSYKGMKGSEYASLRILERGQVVLEWFEKKDQVSADFEAIDDRRKEWIKLCNMHRVKDLVENLYTSDVVYYNHKPIISGHHDVIAEYNYMSSDNYNLKLTPVFSFALSKNVVFEIGQCSGTYGGKYILIWSKEGQKDWKIKMDSNI